MHESTHAAQQPQCLRPTPTRPKHTLRCATFNASEPRLQLLGGFAGGTGPKRRNTPAFPQVGDLDGEQLLPKTAQKLRPMAKSTPVSCETAQKSRGCDHEQSRVNRQRRRERAQPTRASTQHRSERTSVPRSPALGAENGFAAPPRAVMMAMASTMPRRVTFIQLDDSLNLQGKRSRSSSRKQAIHLHRLNSATLLSAYRSLTVISAARQRSMCPAHMSRLAASPLAGIAKRPNRKRLRQSSSSKSDVLRCVTFYAYLLTIVLKRR